MFEVQLSWAIGGVKVHNTHLAQSIFSHQQQLLCTKKVMDEQSLADVILKFEGFCFITPLSTRNHRSKSVEFGSNSHRFVKICENLAQIPQILSGDFGWRVVSHKKPTNVQHVEYIDKY